MKKKLFLIALLLVFALISCGGEEEEDDWGNDGDGGNDQDNNNNEAKEWEINLEETKIQHITIGQNDEIYAAGYTTTNLYGDLSGNGKNDPFLLLLNTKGEKLWGKQFEGASSENNYVSELSIDINGDIYFAIIEINPTIYKFSPDGTKIWEISLSQHFRRISRLKLDKSENLLIVGDAVYPGNNSDIIRYSNQGKELQSYNISGDPSNPTQNNIDMQSLAVDSEGNIYAGGAVSGSLFAENAGSIDAFLVKLAPDGTQLWGKQWGNSKTDMLQDIKIDDKNSIYTTGYSTEESTETFSKFDQDGNKMWGLTKIYTRLVICGEAIYVIKGSRDINGQIDKYNLDGEYIGGSTTFEKEPIYSIACDSKGNVYAVKEGALIKFSPSDFK